MITSVEHVKGIVTLGQGVYLMIIDGHFCSVLYKIESHWY